MRVLFVFLLFYSGFSLAAEPCVAPLQPQEEDPGVPLARRSKPLHPGDPCETADSNIQRSLAEILKSNGGPVIRPSGSSVVKGMDLVSRRFALSSSDQKLLEKNGFVVPERLDVPGYGFAFHEIYQSEVPVYVSVDAILHAIFASNDAIIKDVEKKTILPALIRILANLHCTLLRAGYDRDTAMDLDVYLTVARSLIEDREVKSNTGVDAEVSAIVASSKKASGLEEVTLFGRKRIVDFSQYQPRGHYVDMPGFFRGVMWLSRLEFNLVSRSSRSSQPGDTPDPSETPREAMDALALVDLIGRSGEMQSVIQLDHSWAVLAGKREDISPENLSTLMRLESIAVGRPESFQKLKDAIGAGYVRTIRMHYMPQGSDHLPVIFTLLGPRAVADAQSLMPIVHPSVNSRTMISSADAAYILGNDRAAAYLTQDLLRFSTLRTKLDEARRDLNLDGMDLYSLWMSAIRSLSVTAGSSPSYMKSDAFADMRLNSTVAAFAQIKHNYVLLASQGYDEGGCAIPYGYVEPAVETYAALERYAIRGRLAMVELKAGPEAVSYFQRTERILSALARISRWEREGRSLPPEALRFLSMITEMSPGGTGGPPTYTGWYFDLFYDRNDALRSPALIADFYTSVNEQKVAYAGVSGARLGVFLVETGGERRVVVGPVAVAFSASGGLDKRYTDDDVPSVSRYAPWSASYTVAAPPAPPLSVDYTVDSDSGFHMLLQTDIPELTIELLDHNRRPLASRVFKHPPRDSSFKIPVPAGKEVRAIHISAGEFHTWGEVSWVGYSFRTSTFVEKEP